MAFRANELIAAGFVEAERYLIGRLSDLEEGAIQDSKESLNNLFKELGPVVDGYPDWHPLLNILDGDGGSFVPYKGCGYEGLDHSVFFANGFITCPYGENNVKKVLESIESQKPNRAAYLTAHVLDVSFYSSEATAILVRCNWFNELNEDSTIPTTIAVPLILEYALRVSKFAEFAEPWDVIHPHLLGRPHGKRSSLLINQETGMKIKKLWELLNGSGMFGAIKGG